MIWREKRLLLAILGLVLIANLIFFLTYRVQYESRLEALDSRRDQAKAQLDEARRARIQAEQQIAGYRQIQRDVQQIYDERWATRAQRLTRLIAEVKRLAITANLVPPSTNYSLTEPSGNRGVRGGATEVGITFAVKGTYQQVRRLINMLELSEQFIIIDQISLSSAEGDQLNFNLQIKTLFRESPGAPATPANQQL